MENSKQIEQILEASYLDPVDAKAKLQKMGYNYDNELSTPESKVFVDKNGNPKIAFRGSKRIWDDWLQSDVKLLLVLQKYDKRFQEAKRLTSLVESKYGRGCRCVRAFFGRCFGARVECSRARGDEQQRGGVGGYW